MNNQDKLIEVIYQMTKKITEYEEIIADLKKFIAEKLNEMDEHINGEAQ